jgi:hypothetical protein
MKTSIRLFKAAIAAIAGLTLCLGAMTNANATVLNFDDVLTGSWDSTYHGFTLHNAQTYKASNLWAPAAVSGSNVLINFNSLVGELNNVAGFDFNSAWFTADGRYSGATSQDVQVNGYALDNSLLFTQTINLTTAPRFFTFNWSHLSRLTWDPTGANTTNNIAIDNLTYNANVVPEPASMALLGLGLLGLFTLRRRQSV